MNALDIICKYCAAVIPLIGNEKVGELLHKYGYDDEASIDAVFKAMRECGTEFCKEFAAMARVAINSNEGQEYISIAANDTIDRIAGEDEDDKAAKSERALQWFNSITDLITKGLADSILILQQTNGSASAQQEANRLQQEAVLQQQKNQRTLYIVLAVVVAIIIGAVVFISVKKKK